MIFAEVAGRLESVLISPRSRITDAIAQLDSAGTGALLLSEDGRSLWGLLTDGDIRRAILKGVSLWRPCGEIAMRQPVVGSAEMEQAEILKLLNEHDVDQLPIVEASDQRIRGLLLRRDLVPDDALPISAVIMAGGLGTRLLPLTDATPKPMLPVGDRPLLETIIQRLQRAGISRVHVTTHHLADRITKYFGDGHQLGVDIRYVPEDRPLGTAGGLRLLQEPSEPLLVINGDILTNISFRDFVAYHRKHRADVTIGVRKYDVQVPYGVVECDGPAVRGLKEKPNFSFFVNAGIYLLEPSVHPLIPPDERFDMTDLIQKLLEAGRPLVSYPIVEYWLDVGRPEDLRRAQEEISHAHGDRRGRRGPP
jgi:dTDP-glucose pyrophosphorylase/CBS domain-containing protein